MSVRRITIRVPESVAAQIKAAAGSVHVSSWVTQVIEERLEEDELEKQWEAFCRDVKPTRDEHREAKAISNRLKKRANAIDPTLTVEVV